MANKLSASQNKVLKLMSEGWQLGSYSGFNSNFLLQQGGCGKGGNTERVDIRTFNKLLSLGLIEKGEREPRHTFSLTVYKIKES